MRYPGARLSIWRKKVLMKRVSHAMQGSRQSYSEDRDTTHACEASNSNSQDIRRFRVQCEEEWQKNTLSRSNRSWQRKTGGRASVTPPKARTCPRVHPYVIHYTTYQPPLNTSGPGYDLYQYPARLNFSPTAPDHRKDDPQTGRAPSLRL